MNPAELIALAWNSLIATLRSLATPRLWVPWLLLGAIQAAVVVALAWFAHPAVSWCAVPLVRLLGGADALHYPTIFRLLPALFTRADLVLGALLGAVAAGAATRMFAARFSGRPVRVGEELGWAARHAPALIAINLPLNLLLIALSFAIDFVLERRGGGLVGRAVTIAGLGGAMMLQAAFLFATPLVAVSGLGVGRALLTLPRVFLGGIWAALLLSALVVIALLPLQGLSGLADTLVDRGTPEIVIWVTIVQVGVGLLLGFTLTGSATLVYLGDVSRWVRRRES